MNNHQYILEPYKGMSSRYHCPGCRQKDKTFTLYIDYQTREHLAPEVGRCNRENNCGYHYTPKQYFLDHNITFNRTKPKAYTMPKTIIPKVQGISFIPVEIFKASLKSYETNNLIKYFISQFGSAITNQLIRTYFIGTSKYWDGATVFWQIDKTDKIRAGKIMLYNPTNGKRVKEPFNHITWVHTAIKQYDYDLRQCLFGEHLLKIEPLKPVAIVESEKTAIIASIYLPQFIWLATSGAAGLSIEKCETLNKHGQPVVLFPDISILKEGKETTFEKWTKVANENLLRFSVSDLLERKATEAEKNQGYDIVDYLIKFDYREFVASKSEQVKVEQPHVEQPLVEVKHIIPITPSIIASNPKTPKPDSWEKEIKELEYYFETITVSHLPQNINS
jgi:hypothetical protein